MRLSEQVTNQLKIQGLDKPLKIPSATLSKWRDEVAQLEAINADLLEALEEVIRYYEIGFPLTIATIKPFEEAIAKAKS